MSETNVQEVTQPAKARLERARVLREIGRLAWAVNEKALPSPVSVVFRPDGDLTRIVMRFDSIAQARQWADRLEAHERTEQKIGAIVVFYAGAKWLGYGVEISGTDAGGVR